MPVLTLKLRLVLAGCAGFGMGLLLNRLPFWAAMVVLAGAAIWAFATLASVQRDLNRLKRDLAEFEEQMNHEAGGSSE